MPKRKRSIHDDASGAVSSTDRIRASRQRDVDAHIQSSRKLLHRSLKTAKGFERQKLGKRLTNVTKTSDAPSMSRLRKEIEVVKSLDLDKVVESRLCKGIGKIKALVDSGCLPKEWMAGDVKGWEGEKSEEDIKAWNNVVSGIWNLKIVKDVWFGVIRGFYLAMGIPAPIDGKGKGKKGKERDVKKIAGDAGGGKGSPVEDDDLENTSATTTKAGEREPSWEGFDSPADVEDDDLNSDSGDDENEEQNDSLDEEALLHYDALLANSSDEESFDEQQYLNSHPPASKSINRLSLSLSPSPSRSSSPTPSITLSEPGTESEPSAPLKIKKAKPPKSAQTPAVTKGSTFLPTLMGGYWSGSESSASELSDSEMKPTVRKNRMGQQARRALNEKKFGSGANHIKAGQPSVNIKEEKGRGGKNGGRPDRGRGGREIGRGENVNMTEVKPRVKTRDDVGVLHPSWQAAKKAKEDKLKATFQGKKVVFD